MHHSAKEVFSNMVNMLITEKKSIHSFPIFCLIRGQQEKMFVGRETGK